MSHTWIPPVTDRTQSDVDSAKAQLASWAETIKNGGSVTMGDLKGALNYGDINRVGNDLLYLSENNYYLVNNFSFSKSPGTSWGISSIFASDDMADLLKAATDLKSALVQDYSMTAPDNVNTFEKMNALEAYVYLLKQFEEGSDIRQLFADTFYAGDNTLIDYCGCVISKTIIAVTSPYDSSTGYETIFFGDVCTTHDYTESTGVLNLTVTSAESISYNSSTGVLSVVVP